MSEKVDKGKKTQEPVKTQETKQGIIEEEEYSFAEGTSILK